LLRGRSEPLAFSSRTVLGGGVVLLCLGVFGFFVLVSLCCLLWTFVTVYVEFYTMIEVPAVCLRGLVGVGCPVFGCVVVWCSGLSVGFFGLALSCCSRWW